MSKTVRASAEIQNQIDSLLTEAEALDAKAAEGDITPDEVGKLTTCAEQLKGLTTEKEVAVASEEVSRIRNAQKASRNFQAPTVITSRKADSSVDPEARRKAWQSWALGGKRGYGYSRSDMVAAQDMGMDPTCNTLSINARALSKATSNAPVPEDFLATYSDTIQYSFPVQSVVNILNTGDGRDLPFPVVDDTSNNAAIVGEALGIGSSSDPSFAEVVFKAWKYASPIVKVSSELLQDSSIDIASYLGQAFGKRHGRAYEAAVVSNNAGSAAPEGILHGVTAAVNLITANPMTLAKLIDLEVSIDPDVRAAPGTGWLMHDATWGAIRKMADDNTFPIFLGNLQDGATKQLLGYPVYISNQMTSYASPGDDAPLIVFGNFKEAYTWRTVSGKKLVRLDELFAGTDQVGFMMLERVDGRLIQPTYLATLNSYNS